MQIKTVGACALSAGAAFAGGVLIATIAPYPASFAGSIFNFYGDQYVPVGEKTGAHKWGLRTNALSGIAGGAFLVNAFDSMKKGGTPASIAAQVGFGLGLIGAAGYSHVTHSEKPYIPDMYR